MSISWLMRLKGIQPHLPSSSLIRCSCSLSALALVSCLILSTSSFFRRSASSCRGVRRGSCSRFWGGCSRSQGKSLICRFQYPREPIHWQNGVRVQRLNRPDQIHRHHLHASLYRRKRYYCCWLSAPLFSRGSCSPVSFPRAQPEHPRLAA